MSVQFPLAQGEREQGLTVGKKRYNSRINTMRSFKRDFLVNKGQVTIMSMLPMRREKSELMRR